MTRPDRSAQGPIRGRSVNDSSLSGLSSDSREALDQFKKLAQAHSAYVDLSLVEKEGKNFFNSTRQKTIAVHTDLIRNRYPELYEILTRNIGMSPN